MSGFMLTTEPFIGTKGFILILKKELKILNFQKDLLIAHPEEYTAIFESDADAESEQATFYLVTYKELAGNSDEIPVVISCTIGQDNYLLCVENDSVILKESEVPFTIPSETSEFIFYKRDSFNQFISFESSLNRGFCLAWSLEDQNLMLKPCPTDELDETTLFFLDSDRDIYFVEGLKPNEKFVCNILNVHENLLIAQPEKFTAVFASNADAGAKETMFFLNIYNEDADHNSGLPVTISHELDKSNYVLCVENDSVIFKKTEELGDIPGKTSEFIFYIKEFSVGDSSYYLESSLKPGFCLSWSTEDPEKKLMLKPYPQDGKDETLSFIINDKTNHTP
ncbi:uncharacterized protein LOC142661393 [Rhinoderma darwinii]|uniref:uncharacterized protein LOC142661393 n=1 Tax=Rhinoderma darwinii TaxID=43563 RepID=UPI003F6626B8